MRKKIFLQKITEGAKGKKRRWYAEHTLPAISIILMVQRVCIILPKKIYALIIRMAENRLSLLDGG